MPKIRLFKTGATRDTDDGKLDFEAFLSPLVLTRYAQYMHEHRKQPDGNLRDGDNWQRGIPMTAYMKSMWRHFIAVWTLHRWIAFSGKCNWKDQLPEKQKEFEDALCAVIFNASGYLHEVIKSKK